jgi:hypothetical protein
VTPDDLPDSDDDRPSFFHGFLREIDKQQATARLTLYHQGKPMANEFVVLRKTSDGKRLEFWDPRLRYFVDVSGERSN